MMLAMVDQVERSFHGWTLYKFFIRKLIERFIIIQSIFFWLLPLQLRCNKGFATTRELL
jgi:hypothetical protein